MSFTSSCAVHACDVILCDVMQIKITCLATLTASSLIFFDAIIENF